jgi:hypothetical protein
VICRPLEYAEHHRVVRVLRRLKLGLAFAGFQHIHRYLPSLVARAPTAEGDENGDCREAHPPDVHTAVLQHLPGKLRKRIVGSSLTSARTVLLGHLSASLTSSGSASEADPLTI